MNQEDGSGNVRLNERLGRLCPDCGVEPGNEHKDGCDVERCAACGGQAISCDCREAEYENLPRIKWEGEWHGVAECEEFGWFALFEPYKGWIRCTKETPGAVHDLNRLVTEGVWDRETGPTAAGRNNGIFWTWEAAVGSGLMRRLGHGCFSILARMVQVKDTAS